MLDAFAATPPGTRVSVRHRLPRSGERTTDSPTAPFTETVGTLTDVRDDTFSLLTRGGLSVTIRHDDVVALRVVPPAPSRRGPPHRALSASDVQRLMVDAWPPMERDTLGGWVLRAARGFTGRGNSALAVGDPGRPLAQAVDAVEQWYAARRLPSNLVLVGEVGFDHWATPLGRELRAREYDDRVPTLTLTAATREVAVASGPPSPGWTVDVGAELTPAWFAAYRRYRPVDEVAARAILTGSPEQAFATVRRGDEVVGIGRLGLAHAWGGIAAMWVAPDLRRVGLGRSIVGALARAADARGTRSLHLQTDTDNPGALALYATLGFTPHHTYVNIARHPSPSRDAQPQLRSGR